MKKTLLFAMALAAVCIMSSCEKDPKPSEESTTNQITFGNYEGMDVITYDNIEWEYLELNSDMSYYSKEFDVNGDGTNDFSIVSEVSVDPNSEDLNHPRYMYNISLHSSSNLKFHSQTILNEVYLHVDSTIYPTDSIPLIYHIEIGKLAHVFLLGFFAEIKHHNADNKEESHDGWPPYCQYVACEYRRHDEDERQYAQLFYEFVHFAGVSVTFCDMSHLPVKIEPTSINSCLV